MWYYRTSTAKLSFVGFYAFLKVTDFPNTSSTCDLTKIVSQSRQTIAAFGIVVGRKRQVRPKAHDTTQNWKKMMVVEVTH